jgi:alkylation response protein AidB-like acyl-CoA dehydrogenase
MLWRGRSFLGAIGTKWRNSALSDLSEPFAGLAGKPTRAMKLIRAARELAPMVDAVRQAIERKRELPPDLIDALGAAGMFSLWLPTSLGGPELNVVDFVRVIEELSRVDGSVGWCAAVASAYSFFAGYLRSDVTRRIYDGGRAVVAGALMPSGKAFVTDSGYRVTGHWSYGSGIRHSTWVVGNCVVHDRDGPRRGSDGGPVIRLMIFPTSAVEVIDTWSVSGLRGTGSHDYRVADLFVPEDHTINYSAPQAAQAGTLYAVPVISVLAVAIAAVPLGIARSAIDEVVALAATKTTYGSSTLLRDKPIVQADVARAEVLLGSARSYLFAMIGELWREVAGGGAASMQRRGMVRLACAHATQASAQAVDLMYNAAGGTAIFETGRLERCFRDVHASTQHIATSSSNYEAGGRMLLGLDPGEPRF